MSRNESPGSDSPDRGQTGPFAALVASATTDPGAARGLATAYATLGAQARRRLVEAVVFDADAEGVDASSALAALLSVEPDTEIATTIFERMRALDGKGLERLTPRTAHIAGDGTEGAMVLGRPLYGGFLELVIVAWKGSGVTRAQVEPMVHQDSVDRHLSTLSPGLSLSQLPFEHALDYLAELLWRHRHTAGGLPPGVEKLAALF